MSSMKMKMPNDTKTCIPNDFIDKYMVEANPIFVMVYIYGFRHCCSGNPNISVKEIAENFNLLQSDVIKAWEYWDKVELIKIVNKNLEDFSIEFLPMPEEKNKNDIKINISMQPSSYSAEEIDIYMKRSDDIRVLFKSAENILAKPLSYNELNMLLTFIEWYGLPIDVIEVMLEYCVRNNKTSRKYMESLARDWSEKEIESVEDAKKYISKHSFYYKILKALGISNKSPNNKQIYFMDHWICELEIPHEIILEACEQSFLNTGASSFEYANGILSDWYNKNVTTLADVKKANAEFKKNNKMHFNKKQSQIGYRNRFINYEQREWDYDRIERLAQQELYKGE